jgi:hydroxymethylglutaryl-CoA synthase
MNKIMKPRREVGIVGYGAYIPKYRLRTKEISRIWRSGEDENVLPIEEKSVPGPDEDTITMAIEASQNAIARSQIAASQLQGVYVGSESHPYAVKPSGTLLAQALGVSPNTVSGDFEFACKAGTEAMQAAFGLVGSEMADYALAIGMDTAQGKPGDALEYTAAAGGAAFTIGPAEKSLAILEGSFSYVTDTPDFFRRAYQKYPEHGNRFTGDLAYFHHIENSVTALLDGLSLKPEDFSAVIFHQPNVKFPKRMAKTLNFKTNQIKNGLLAGNIGNTYAGAAVLGLAAVLDAAKPGDRILLASFGSGAGSDAFSFMITDQIEGRNKLAKNTQWYIDRRIEIDYAMYAKWRNKIVLGS